MTYETGFYALTILICVFTITSGVILQYQRNLIDQLDTELFNIKIRNDLEKPYTMSEETTQLLETPYRILQ